MLKICHNSTPNVYLTRKNAEGVDVIMLWCDHRNDSAGSTPNCDEHDDSSSGIILQEKLVFHLAAIELKDRRSTKPAEWTNKIESLTSPRCLFWWLKELAPVDFALEFHIVFAGREHCSED